MSNQLSRTRLILSLAILLTALTSSVMGQQRRPSANAFSPQSNESATTVIRAARDLITDGEWARAQDSPRFLKLLTESAVRSEAVGLSRRVLALTKEIAAVDGESALACFRSSSRALRSVSIEQFEAWARRGLSSGRSGSDARARRSYFSLETRGSYEALHSGGAGLPLDSIQHLLRLYVEALTGREVEVAPLAAVPDEARIGDGRTIHLPSVVNEFGDDELDFRLYKVLAAHAAGQIEFGTYECNLGVV